MRHLAILSLLLVIILFTCQLILSDEPNPEESVNVEVHPDGTSSETSQSDTTTSDASNTKQNDVDDKDKDQNKTKEDFKFDPQIFYDYFMKMYASDPTKQQEIQQLFDKHKGEEKQKELMDILMKMMQGSYGGYPGGGYPGGGYGGYGGGGGYGGYGDGYGYSGSGRYGGYDGYKPPKKPKIKKTGKKYLSPTSHLRAKFEGTVDLYDDFDEDDIDLPFIVWMAPFFSGGGYCSEALSYIEYLSVIDDTNRKIHIAHHGDSVNYEYIHGLSDHHQRLLQHLASSPLPVPYLDIYKNTTIIVICHSEPGAWFPPNYATSACPPFVNISQSFYDLDEDEEPEFDMSQIMRFDNVYYVGRTMFETDRLPKNWDTRLNVMDAIWVPTSFHFDIFTKYGNLTDDTELWILPQSVNTTFYSPNYGLTKDDILNNLELSDLDIFKHDPFIFLSVFKWEERKGWKYLLQAYLSEFSENDNVELLILTNAYHTEDDFDIKIQEFITEDEYLSAHFGNDTENIQKHIASLHVVPNAIPNDLMPQLYQLGDCFVLPSRGEGWGRPHVEAMSMGLPIIATNWSGPTEYIEHGHNGYLIKVDEFEEITEGAFRGHQWARPNVAHLRELMRDVVERKGYMKNIIGKNARIDMRKKYCIDCIGKILLNKLKSLTAKLQSA